jgi:DNA transposition AAA+ family ATPase
MEKIDTHQWRRSVSRWEFLRKHFNQSDRPIIIDNAHRLTSHGRCWIFDFHDATGTPFVLVGNPEILDDIARDRGEDQQSTRIGICPELRFNKSRKLADAVNKTLAHRLPQKGFSRLADSIRPLALEVAKRKGHLRALNKQLNVALEFFEKQKFPTLKDSFMAAHELLIRDYALEA